MYYVQNKIHLFLDTYLHRTFLLQTNGKGIH